MEGTAAPFTKQSLVCVGPVLTTEANFPDDGSLALSSLQGTFMDVVSGEADHPGKGGI